MLTRIGSRSITQETGTTVVDMQGLRLTDDDANTAKWVFPSLELGAGQYLVVFASNKNRNDQTKPLHRR